MLCCRCCCFLFFLFLSFVFCFFFFGLAQSPPEFSAVVSLKDRQPAAWPPAVVLWVLCYENSITNCERFLFSFFFLLLSQSQQQERRQLNGGGAPGQEKPTNQSFISPMIGCPQQIKPDASFVFLKFLERPHGMPIKT